MVKTTKYVALDIHKDSITVAVACEGQKTPRLYGAIPTTGEALAKLCGKLAGRTMSLRFCYEAGPCGYGVYRQLRGLGHECSVVAPSLIPRRPGDHIKTDRRDALSLSRLFKNGELTPVWVPDVAQEAMRDLERCREDFKHAERRVRQRLTSFLLRHGRHYGGRSRWSQAHFRWLETQRFAHPAQQIVFQEYVDAVQEAQERIKGLDQALQHTLETWPREDETRGLMALRGVNTLTAITTLAELGDLTRFDSPRQLMAFVGLVPSEHSSGSRQQRGAITKAGNAHVRRVLKVPGRQIPRAGILMCDTSLQVQFFRNISNGNRGGWFGSPSRGFRFCVQVFHGSIPLDVVAVTVKKVEVFLFVAAPFDCGAMRSAEFLLELWSLV